MAREFAEFDAPGISVRAHPFAGVASLRYFDPEGEFVRTLTAAAGGALPGPQRAVSHQTAGGAAVILACCNRTETWALCSDTASLAALEAAADERHDGCCVDLTGGLWIALVTGPRSADLLCRLGSTDIAPKPGEARTGRLAELSVTCVCIRPGEILLLVERVYGDHLRGWIAETLADW